jgi:molybdate transport system substrate-binding protein
VRRSRRAQRGGSLKRIVIVGVCALLVLVLLVGVGYGVRRILDRGGSNVVTRTLGGGQAGDPNTISIYAPSQLSAVLERITTTFQQEQPGSTFQFTLGPSEDLATRIRGGQKPNLYIDTVDAVGQVPAKDKPSTAAPAPFGYDGLALAVKRNNPKQVKGLDVFGNGSSVTTGICAPELLCGRDATQALQRAGVSAAPSVVTSNVSELTDGLKTGRIDAVFMFRSDLRRVITSITNISIGGASIRVDYQMLQLKTGGPADQFIQWLQGSPSARQALKLSGMLSFYEN